MRSLTIGIVPFSYSSIDHIKLLTFLICNRVQKRDETPAFSMTSTPYLFYLPLSHLPPPYQKLFATQKAVPLRKRKSHKNNYYTIFSIQNRLMINTCSMLLSRMMPLKKNTFTSIYWVLSAWHPNLQFLHCKLTRKWTIKKGQHHASCWMMFKFTQQLPRQSAWCVGSSLLPYIAVKGSVILSP